MRERSKTIELLLVLTAGASLMPAPASAQGLFEALFGGLRQAIRSTPPVNISAYSDPFVGLRRAFEPSSDRLNGGDAAPVAGYCVRTCDGHFFPVQAQGGVSTAEMCSSFCPASETKLYSGGGINNAVARDGSRYTDLPNAFAYRQKLVEGCTCNGKSAFGVAPVDVKTDPTLRPGDIVATHGGFTAFTGMRNKAAEFTPIDSYRALSKTTRDKLADTKILPANPGAPAVIPVTLSGRARKADEARRAYNDR